MPWLGSRSGCGRENRDIGRESLARFELDISAMSLIGCAVPDEEVVLAAHEHHILGDARFAKLFNREGNAALLIKLSVKRLAVKYRVSVECIQAAKFTAMTVDLTDEALIKVHFKHEVKRLWSLHEYQMILASSGECLPIIGGNGQAAFVIQRPGVFAEEWKFHLSTILNVGEHICWTSCPDEQNERF